MDRRWAHPELRASRLAAIHLDGVDRRSLAEYNEYVRKKAYGGRVVDSTFRQASGGQPSACRSDALMAAVVVKSPFGERGKWRDRLSGCRNGELGREGLKRGCRGRGRTGEAEGWGLQPHPSLPLYSAEWCTDHPLAAFVTRIVPCFRAPRGPV